MNRPHKRTLFAAGFILLLLAAYALFCPAPEPIYDGQPLSYWVRECSGDYGTSSSDMHAARVHQAIIAMGTNIIPWLLKYLRYQPPGWYYSTNP